MELRHIRYFVAVAEDLHFGRAAKRLNVSQPALSQQISALEQAVGAPLLLRQPKGASLTAAGTAFLKHAREALAAAHQAVEEARFVANGETGSLKVGLPETERAVTLASKGIAAFCANHPNVAVRTTGQPWLEQLRAVADGKLDVGFCWTGDDGDPERLPFNLSGRRLIYDPGEYALLPGDHVLAAGTDVHLEDLQAFPFGIYERHLHPPLYDHLIRYLQIGGVKTIEGAPGVTSAAGSVPLVLARGGWTFVSRLVGLHPPVGVVARRIRGLEAPAGIEVIWRSDDRRWLVREVVRHIEQAAQAYLLGTGS
ncbi:MAG TPA: LysR family transcriptional regulator [Allosphingosinicella sp.]|nr:LysR family transcriptional regulator [Allosphingosinicella sp.]